MFYNNDSFSTLTPSQQIGLLILSSVLWGLTLWGTHCLIKNKKMALRLIISGCIFFLFIWLSPQVYYAYYQILWPDLAWQIVIQSPPRITHLLELITFSGRATTSWHARGLVGASLLILAMLPALKKIAALIKKKA